LDLAKDDSSRELAVQKMKTSTYSSRGVKKTMKPIYSIIGLGKLGASMAAAIASRGFSVIGVDINQRAVDLVNAGHAPVQETYLEGTVNVNRQHLRATLSHKDDIQNSSGSFVIIPTYKLN
jgi:UDPglucose 6-dehydrogenase